MSSLTWEFYLAVKEVSHCVICGDKTTQLHHVRPVEKIAEVGKIARIGNMPLLRHEFNKTIPLCGVHHRAVHRGQMDGYMDGLFDNGKLSSDHHARRYMPWLEVIGEPEIG